MRENTPANQNVGLPITATDADGDSLTYTFSGPDMDHFTFIPATAQIRTKSGQTYDYETHELFIVRVTADDGNGGTKTATVVIYVRNIDEPPAAPTRLTLVQAYPTSMALSWTPPDNTGRPPITGYDVQYKKSNESTLTAGLQGVTATSDSITGLAPSTSTTFRYGPTTTRATERGRRRYLARPRGRRQASQSRRRTSRSLRDTKQG